MLSEISSLTLSVTKCVNVLTSHVYPLSLCVLCHLMALQYLQSVGYQLTICPSVFSKCREATEEEEMKPVAHWEKMMRKPENLRETEEEKNVPKRREERGRNERKYSEKHSQRSRSGLWEKRRNILIRKRSLWKPAPSWRNIAMKMSINLICPSRNDSEMRERLAHLKMRNLLLWPMKWYEGCSYRSCLWNKWCNLPTDRENGYKYLREMKAL